MAKKEQLPSGYKESLEKLLDDSGFDFETGDFKETSAIRDQDLSDEIQDDEARKNAISLVNAFVKSLSKKRVNQFISAVHVEPDYSLVDLKSDSAVDTFIEKIEEFDGINNLYNLPDLLRLLPSLLFSTGQAAFVVRRDVNNPNQKLGVSISNNFLYKYDNYQKLTYLMVMYQSKQGIESETIVETYDLKEDKLIFDVITDGKHTPIVYKLSELVGTEESPIPAVLIFNAWQPDYRSDIDHIQGQLKQLTKIYTAFYRNLDHSGAFSFDGVKGEAISIQEREAEQKRILQTGQAQVGQSFMQTGKIDAINTYIDSNMSPTIEALQLAKAIEAGLDDFLNFKSYELSEKGAQQNIDAIQAADALNLQALQNFADYINPKLRQLYTMLLQQVNYFDDTVKKVNVSIKDSFIFKEGQDRASALQEYQMGARTLENFILNFGIGTLSEKLKQINQLLKQKEEQEQAGNEDTKVMGEDNKSIDEQSNINAKEEADNGKA